MKMDETDAGKRHLWALKEVMNKNNVGMALIGFVDNCNHIHPINDEVYRFSFNPHARICRI